MSDPELNDYAEIADSLRELEIKGRDIIIERPEAAQLGYTMLSGWDSEGRYIYPNE